MRISTAEIFGNGIGTINDRQGELSRVQQQLATGRRMLTPSDDPSGAVQALKFRERIAAVEQFARNASLGSNRLEQEETVLAQMSDAVSRVRELTLQAANATQSNESRAAIAREIRQVTAGLVDAANSRDANGEYLFAGNRTGSRPFVQNASGAIEYLGDAAQRRIALSPDRSVAVGDSGEIFMNLPQGNGRFSVTPAADNSGTGRVVGAEIIDPTAIDGSTFRIEITAEGGYEVYDAADDLVASGPVAADQAIDIGGRRILLEGSPAPGDRFDVAPAGRVSLFDAVDAIAAALEQPRNGPAQRAQLQHGIDRGLENLDQALSRLLEVRTDVGARLNTIDSQGIVNDDQKLQLQTLLSSIEDLDFAEAISRFNLQQVALQAAQQTYVQLGRLSLFDFLR